MRLPRIPVNGLLVGIVAAVLLAFLVPGPGARGGVLRSEVTAGLGVALVFLLQGIALPTERLREDLRDWRLHLVVQAFGFGVFPAIVLAADLVGGHLLAPELRLGFLFLAMLPTTISTATVFSTLAGGSVAAAIFNTTLSNLAGIVLVPLWSAWHLASATGRPVDALPLLAQVAQLLLLPLVLGQCLRPWLGDRVARHRAAIGRASTGVILFIVHVAFCNSVVDGTWRARGAAEILVALGLAAVLLGVTSVLCHALLGRLGFSPAARVTGFFCATQKTLAAGVPLAGTVFAGATHADGAPVALGLLLLPLLCFHPLQLVVGGWLAGRWAAGGPRG